MYTFQCGMASILARGVQAGAFLSDSLSDNTTENSDGILKIADGIVETCHQAANSTRTGLPPERIYLTLSDKNETIHFSSSISSSDSNSYDLR